MPSPVYLVNNPWLRSSQASGVNLLLFFYKVSIVSNCPLNLYLCIHRLVQLSDLIREVSLCCRQRVIQKLTFGQLAENKCL